MFTPGATQTPGNGERPDIVRYETPDFKGLSAAMAWGEDDVWDTAVYYKGEWNGIKVAARAGYAQYTDTTIGPGSGHCIGSNGTTVGESVILNAGGGGVGDAKCEEWGGSATVMHVPTGLYVYGAYGKKHDNNRFDDGINPTNLGPNKDIDKDDEVWYIQPGIERKWHPLGTTTIFGTYRYDNNGARNTFSNTVNSLPLPTTGDYYTSGAAVQTWGGGVVQNIEAAAMDLYLIYSHADGEFTAVSRATGQATRVEIDDFDLLQAGARIQF